MFYKPINESIQDSNIFYHCSPVQGIKKFRLGLDTSGNNKGYVLFASKHPSFSAAFGLKWNDGNARFNVETRDSKVPTEQNYMGTILQYTDKVNLDVPCSMYKIKGKFETLRYPNDIEYICKDKDSIEILSEEQFKSFRDAAKVYHLKLEKVSESYILNRLKGSKTSTFEKSNGKINKVDEFTIPITSESCLADFLKGDKKDCMYVEKTLTSEERNKLKDSDFGIPELRKYPLIDKGHVIKAMQYFDKADEKYKYNLAKRIVKRAKELNVGINIKSDMYRKYYCKDNKPITSIKESNINESNYSGYLKKLPNIILKRKVNTDKKYSCPFCNYRDNTVELVYHINQQHEDMIPENFTAARVLYNYIHNKENGTCRFCKGPTPWDESRWKYKCICGSDKCKKAASDLAAKNLMKVRGITKSQLLSDPEQQNKMLSNRKISGEYDFKGEKKSYVGSYELKLLEFYDKVLNCTPDEIQTPGPVIEYMFNGKKHMWITDLYYVTANLVHDAKDGGDNPNTRNMEEYRAKQLAKEKAIEKQGKYNYIRITNNNFEQLFEVLSDLKYLMIDDTVKNKTICSVYENMALGSFNPVIGSGTDNYIVNYGCDNIYAGHGYTTDKLMTSVYSIDDKGNIRKQSAKEFLEMYPDHKLYHYTQPKDSKSIIEQIESDMNNQKIVEYDYFYNLLTEGYMIVENQIMDDVRFKPVLNLYQYSDMITESNRVTLLQEYNSVINKNLAFTESSDIKFSIKHCLEGYFVQNNFNKKCSGYYSNINDIPDEVYTLLK